MSEHGSSTPSRNTSPTHGAVHHNSNSFDQSLSEISLNDVPLSPTPSRNGYLSPTRQSIAAEQDDAGDIGVSIPLPVSPVTSPPPLDPPRNHGRLLTRSPSPSPIRPSTSSRADHDGPTSPSRRPSSPYMSPLSSPSRPSSVLSGSGVSSPPPRFIPFKPTLPSATIALNGNTEDVDPTAPFESIPLQTTPPPPPFTAPLPSSPSGSVPTGKSRKTSWGGASAHSHAQSSASSLQAATCPPSANGEANSEAGPSKPRLHAPPAHPHPYPIPSTPPTHTRNLSSSSASSVSAHPGGAGSATGTVLAHATHLAPTTALGVKGTSAFEKFRSQTRPSYLPPKPKEEDETHLHEWESMMAQAREHERERRRVAEIRRLEKEKRMAVNTPRWEVLLGPDFSAARVREDESLRRLWFEGVPSHLRGKAWSLAIGNPLAMSKDAYKTYLARAKRSLDSERFPQQVLHQMEYDMSETLPSLKLYVPGSPMRDDLREFVCAWVVYRSDEGLGYAPYITHLAAMFLLSSPPAQAFSSLANLLYRPCMRAFYTQTKDEIDAYYRVFENLQADMFPKIFANCKNLGLKLPESYFRSMFIEQVPFEACCRLWDQIMLDGDGYIFRSALAIFAFLEPRLYYPDKEEIESVLEGRNRATMTITEREKERAKLKGEAVEESLDGKLSVFGLNEGALFDWLEADGWKESRFERLVKREMPD